MLDECVPIEIDNMGADPWGIHWHSHVTGAAVLAEPSLEAQRLDELPLGSSRRGVPVLHVPTDTEWLALPEGGFISLTAMFRLHPANVPVDGVIPIGSERVNRWWGLPPDYLAADLVEVPPPYHTGREDRRYLLRAPALEALVTMLAAAQAQGLDIRVGSAYRSWGYQKDLYDRAVAKDGAAQRYSAPPGHSEHQLGTAVDLTDVGQRHFIVQSFGETDHYRWLAEKAVAYGWHQSYTPDNIPQTGYICEPWHWRYLGDEHG
jgi:hypothetical protein